MKTYSKYIDNREHVWYDSSNIVYSVVFDNQTDSPKDLKIVFKGGRTYIYHGVDPLDYILFRDSESQGKEFRDKIAKYAYSKLDDTDIDSLDKMKNKFINSDTDEFAPVDLGLRIEINNKTGEFQLYRNGEKIFESIENRVSVINLFKSMNMVYCIGETENTNTTQSEFEKIKITD